LRCKDLDVTRRFYEKIGLVFQKERHGTGLEHYASEIQGFVLELYPVTASQPSDSIRLGFATDNLAEVAGSIRHSTDVMVLKPPYTSADRVMMLLQDPDGRRVEVSQSL
jgi:lactoylglutathione lyase